MKSSMILIKFVAEENYYHRETLAKLFVRCWAIENTNRSLPIGEDGSVRWCFMPKE